MKRTKVLMTAGPVYGRIDSNKIVSNRSTGTWALRFLPSLVIEGYKPVLVVGQTLAEKARRFVNETGLMDDVTIEVHDGYYDYARICHEYADSKSLQGAIMAAAVLNYIPVHTYDGKLPTDDETISIDFKLAPKVINGMKERDPYITLIGCKLLFGVSEDKLEDAAYKVILNSKANAVVANEGTNLRRKLVVHQDQTTIPFDDEFDDLYDHLLDLLADEYYSTEIENKGFPVDDSVKELFDQIADRYRDLFVQRHKGQDFYLGAVAVACPGDCGVLVSPREKGQDFTADDAAYISLIEDQTIYSWPNKGSLNAPLLARHLGTYHDAEAVLHFHEDLDPDENGRVHLTDKGATVGLSSGSYPCVPYAPPGTRRDNEREIPGPSYYIKGHGWVIALDANGDPVTE